MGRDYALPGMSGMGMPLFAIVIPLSTTIYSLLTLPCFYLSFLTYSFVALWGGRDNFIYSRDFMPFFDISAL
uniref:Uncharacterized protein n=1 Tax=Picea glauca TaxID=3330 RepID=A0A101M495_PICGL|nr:hypothetical protein ABT39_MTgene471 [Picea glauca]QHR91234.1 hypothetical protein Q903MT_gene5266 [Picea sitchensis]